MEGREYGFGMLRPSLEYKVNSGLDIHRDYDSEEGKVTRPDETESITIVDSRVPGLGEYGAPLKIVYTSEAVTVQVDIHESNLPVYRHELESLVQKRDDLALSEVGGEKFELYEYAVIDTVATELGKYYNHTDNKVAIKSQSEARLVYPADYVIEEVADPHVYPFCCQLDPEKFWELR